MDTPGSLHALGGETHRAEGGIGDTDDQGCGVRPRGGVPGAGHKGCGGRRRDNNQCECSVTENRPPVIQRSACKNER